MIEDFKIIYGRDDEFRRDIDAIPYINFPDCLEIKMVPPFGGATVRFVARLKGQADTVSVYLDCHERLGFFGEPHWEVYPDKDDNNARFKIEDIEGLLDCILGSLSNPIEGE